MVELLKLVAAVLTLLHFLGPWGSLALIGVIVAAGVALYTQGDRLLEWFIHREARGMGLVMKEASVTIHSVTPAPEPDPSVWRTGDDEEDDLFEEQLAASGLPEGDFDWYKIDASIEPKPDASGAPVAWEPTMIQFRKNDGVSPPALEFSMDCLIAQVEHQVDGNFVVFDHGSLSGPARLRLYAGVAPGIADLQLCYLGEVLGGAVKLPAAARRARPAASTHLQRAQADARL
jgi:hypothetical protein